MKRLNRKGFTLVELLAVIVILAIVVGIALTTVLPTLKKSRQNAFDLTANTAGDYLEKQYQMELIGDISGTSYDTTLFPSGTPKGESNKSAISAAQFKAAGLKSENYMICSSTPNEDCSYWYVKTETNRACVHLVAATRTRNSSAPGQYYDVETDTVNSDGC